MARANPKVSAGAAVHAQADEGEHDTEHRKDRNEAMDKQTAIQLERIKLGVAGLSREGDFGTFGDGLGCEYRSTAPLPRLF